MWFRFPDGVEQISANLQNFKTEVTQEGKAFFRAPDHFAPLILDLPGFAAERPQGKDIPDDLPTSMPGSENALDTLTQQLSAAKESEAAVRETLSAVTNERDKLMAALKVAKEEVDRLKAPEDPEKKNKAA